MKASKKILLITVGLISVLFITGLMLVRNDLLTILRQAEAATKFKAVSVENFTALDFSAHWIVKIKQGDECKVELAMDEDSLLKPMLKNIEGTLYFSMDTTQAKEKTLRARVTVPSLQAVKSMHGTEIHLQDFKADSIHLILENGSTFTGYNNHFKYISFKTSGDVLLQLTNDDEL